VVGGAIWYFDGSGCGVCCLGSVAVVLSHWQFNIGLFDVGEWVCCWIFFCLNWFE
jgi:hypothetical protein